MKNNPIYSVFFIALILHTLGIIIFSIIDLSTHKKEELIDKVENKRKSIGSENEIMKN